METDGIPILSSGCCLRVNCLHVQSVHFLLSNIPKSLHVRFINLKIMLLLKKQLNKILQEKEQLFISETGPLLVMRPNLRFLQHFKTTHLSLFLMNGLYTKRSYLPEVAYHIHTKMPSGSLFWHLHNHYSPQSKLFQSFQLGLIF